MSTNAEDFADELHSEQCAKALKDVIETLQPLENTDKCRIIRTVEAFFGLKPTVNR